MQNYKIKVPNTDISIGVQEKAFQLGYSWKLEDIRNTAQTWGIAYLFLYPNGNMLHGGDREHFNLSENTEISYQDFLNIGNINNIMPEQKEIKLKLVKQPAKAKNLTVGNEYTGIYTDADNTQVDDIKDAKYFFCVNNNHGEARYAINLFEQPAPVVPPRRIPTYQDILNGLYVDDDRVTAGFDGDTILILGIGTDYFQTQTSYCSCGIEEIEGLNSLYDYIAKTVSEVDFEFDLDEDTFIRDLFKAIVVEKIKSIAGAFALLSTQTSEAAICEIMDEICEDLGGTSRVRVNPNSHNEIKVWLIDVE